MNCMKCGTKTPDEQVFCDTCLEQMAKYPVRPNVVVQLPPKRTETPVKKKRIHKTEQETAEEIRRLRSWVRWLAMLLAVALIAFFLMAFLLVQSLNKQGVGPLFLSETVVAADVSRETLC